MVVRGEQAGLENAEEAEEREEEAESEVQRVSCKAEVRPLLSYCHFCSVLSLWMWCLSYSERSHSLQTFPRQLPHENCRSRGVRLSASIIIWMLRIKYETKIWGKSESWLSGSRPERFGSSADKFQLYMTRNTPLKPVLSVSKVALKGEAYLSTCAQRGSHDDSAQPEILSEHPKKHLKPQNRLLFLSACKLSVFLTFKFTNKWLITQQPRRTDPRPEALKPPGPLKAAASL